MNINKLKIPTLKPYKLRQWRTRKIINSNIHDTKDIILTYKHTQKVVHKLRQANEHYH